jgi:RND superfamily putative drug exporter
VERLAWALGTFVVSRRWWIIIGWFVLAAALWVTVPSWNSLAKDGDLAFLPADSPSVIGDKLLDVAFPYERSRSQLVIVLSRADEPLTRQDELVAYDLLRRLYHRAAVSSWQRAEQYSRKTSSSEPLLSVYAETARRQAGSELDAALKLDEDFYNEFRDRLAGQGAQREEDWPRLASAYQDASQWYAWNGDGARAAELRETALQLRPAVASMPPMEQRESNDAWDSVLDVWSWTDEVLGQRFGQGHPHARLIVMPLESEFLANQNSRLLDDVQQLLRNTRQHFSQLVPPGLTVELTGSAAVGGEMRAASEQSVRYTEWTTLAFVLLMLTLVYRSPMLVVVPVAAVTMAVFVALRLCAGWSWIGEASGGRWPELEIYVTTRAFMIVLLFGSGVDFCLFLISRLREEISGGRPWLAAVREALAAVMPALIGSAGTTIVGLSMLGVAEFRKFRDTGLSISIGLVVALLVCVTFAPAVLSVLGPRSFWPTRPIGVVEPSRLWRRWAQWISSRPAPALFAGIIALALPASIGWWLRDDVTYDFSSQLDPRSASRRGLQELSHWFPVGGNSPITVLVHRPGLNQRPWNEDESRLLAEGLTESLYSSGVEAVRSLEDPLGEYPPGKKMSLFSREAWRRRLLREHRATRRLFQSDQPGLEGRFLRLDVVPIGNPLGADACALVPRLVAQARDRLDQMGAVAAGAEVAVAGPAVGLADLQHTTRNDQWRIQLAVTCAVGIVLLLLMRDLRLSLFLLATVILSYFATLGVTIMFFRWLYGDTYVGIDWKVPLFLFVILVAVGQDYNVYLVSRVREEMRRGTSRLLALRRAVMLTGGIITSCGLLMAGTFLTMSSAAWWPTIAGVFGIPQSSPQTLRGMTELGVALTLGVLVDSLYVRSILLPSFLAWRSRAADHVDSMDDHRRPDVIT